MPGARYDIVVGIPTREEAATVGAVAEACDAGLRSFAPGARAAIVNADNASADGTREAFLAARTSCERVHLSTGERGKGRNVRAILRFAREAGADRVALIDGDLSEPDPDWVGLLLGPLDRFDFAAPYYRRHRFDGSCTNQFCYPLLHALTGAGVRQPIGGDFGLSGRMAENILSLPWPPDAQRFGIDVLLTWSALAGGFRVCQVPLGAKDHRERDATHNGRMIREVTATLLDRIHRGPVRLGAPAPVLPGPRREPVERGPHSAGEVAPRGLAHAEEALARYVAPATADAVRAACDATPPALHSELWCRVVAELVGAAVNHGPERSIARALTGLQFARTASFEDEVGGLDDEAVEASLRDQAERLSACREAMLAGAGAA
jgi:glucosylglycerate synthase